MLSKVSTTLGLSSASMAASESEFSISSSKSPSAAASGFPSLLPFSFEAAGAGVCASTGEPGTGRRHDRLAVGTDHRRRHGLGVGAGIGRFEIDDVAQEHLSLVELVTPNDDGLEGERALAQAGDHRL